MYYIHHVLRVYLYLTLQNYNNDNDLSRTRGGKQNTYI